MASAWEARGSTFSADLSIWISPTDRLIWQILIAARITGRASRDVASEDK